MVRPAAPPSLSLLRHARSIGNEAADAAEASGVETIELPCRDADVPLAEIGVTQARAVGTLLARTPGLAPELVVSSPFARARQTATLALEEAGLPDVPVTVDERWRDRDLGILDQLTRAGIHARYPDEVKRRSWHGRLYYRAPGAESWSDVMLRIRSALFDLTQLAGDQRVLVVTHEVPVLMVRALLEGLEEEKLYELAGPGYPNASLTTYEKGEDGQPRLAAWAQVLDQKDPQEPARA